MANIVRGIYKGIVSKKGEYGIAPKMLFIDLYVDNKFLCSSFEFSLLKSFKSVNLKPSNLIEFEATVVNDSGLKIKRPKNIKKIDLSFLAESFNYCCNKFLKSKKALTPEALKQEKIAFIKLYNHYGDNLEFWKFLSLGFELNSLNWFLTQKGEDLVKEAFIKYNKNNVDIPVIKPHYVLQNEPIAQPILLKKKKTILEFIK